MIYSFDPFFGFFSGALYDTIVEVRPELWTYRAGSLATLAGAVLVASSLGRGAGGRIALLSMRASPMRAWRLGLGIAALSASLLMTACGSTLGHWQSAETIASALGARSSGSRCDVVFPDSLPAPRASLLLRDCEEELTAVEERLHTRLTGRLVAYFFRDGAEKHRLMGAADTSIAKPWRREVYLQLSAYPHPLLGHEVAHVVAGSFARGPFRVGASLWGLWPNPGLIEGVAESASPDDDELTSSEWARAMLDLGILPRMSRVFSLGFLGDNAARSYTVAGAFVAWVTERWGAGVLHAWYAGESLERLTLRRWDDLDAEFRTALRTLELPASASAYARARFDRPSVWSRRCPHMVDLVDQHGDACRNEGRFALAQEAYSKALAKDSNDWHALVETAKIDLFQGEELRGRGELERLTADDAAPRPVRDRAEESLADDDLVQGKFQRAHDRYVELANRVLDENVARTMEVKAMGALDPDARSTVMGLLVGERGNAADPWLGALSLGEWVAKGENALAMYLVGRNLVLRDRYEDGGRWLDRAMEIGVSTQRIQREALRERVICACALRDASSLTRLKPIVSGSESPFASARGRRDWLQRLIGRCGAPLGM